MIDFLAAHEFLILILFFGLAGVSVGLHHILSPSFHRAFDAKFRSAVLQNTPARTEYEIAGLYFRALWSPRAEMPFASRDLRAIAPRSLVIWAWIYRWLRWVVMTFWILSIIPIAIERLDIRDLNLGNYGPDRYKSVARYHWAVDAIFAYLRYVISGSGFVIGTNVLIMCLAGIYVFSPRARTAVNGHVARLRGILKRASRR